MKKSARRKGIRRLSSNVVIDRSIYVIADGKVFIDSIKSSLEALVLLMAVYFVFNIKYCDAIFSACIFLEHVLLGKIIQKYRPELRLNSQ